MAENSKIEWTHHTWNPWRGCTKVSAGCANCYAETLSGRNPGTLGVWGPNGTRVVAAEAAWKEPVKWDKKAKAAGERHRVFCASLADVFEADGTMPKSAWLSVDRARVRLFKLIEQTPNLDWLLLTKRPENIMPTLKRVATYDDGCEFVTSWYFGGAVPSNVWLGTSVENQQAADERIPHLLKVPAAVRFLSCEPLLGPVDLSRFHIGWFRCPECREGRDPNTEQPLGSEVYCGDCQYGGPLPVDGLHLHWVIVGGESGHGARPMHPMWARSLRDQCQAAGVPFFFKQHGEWSPADEAGWFAASGDESKVRAIGERGQAALMHKLGKKAAGRLLDGREWSEFPAITQ